VSIGARPVSIAARPGSRRNESKARTRQALVEAALDLFAEDGYDATTTEAIAERANVSPRTFFRYFATKESVLFFGEYDYIRSFAGVYLAQPRSLPELEAIRASFLMLAPALSRIKARIARYEQATVPRSSGAASRSTWSSTTPSSRTSWPSDAKSRSRTTTAGSWPRSR
jgi:AcrR family transcriptional regulator